MKNDYKKLLLGICVLIVGLLYGGNQINLWHFDLWDLCFKGWWTLILIVPGIIMLTEGFNWPGFLMTLFGFMWLADAREWFGEFDVWKLSVPICVVCVGVELIISSLKKRT